MSMIKNRGFTLIEVAIVLVIVGFLLAGVLGSLSAQKEVLKLKEDRVTVKQVEEALLSFAMVNGYLPCPDTDNDGVENRDANNYCSGVQGTIPFLELQNVGRQDAYGNGFLYAVNTNANTINSIEICEQASYFGRSGTYDPNPDLTQCTISKQYYCPGDCSEAAGANCDNAAAPAEGCQTQAAPIAPGWTTLNQISSAPYYRLLTPPIGATAAFDGSLQVCNESAAAGSCSNATPNNQVAAKYVAAVVIAYGEDGAITRANCNDGMVSASERENCDGDRYFHLDNQSREQFDDVVGWISAYQLKQVMLKAGRDMSVR